MRIANLIVLAAVLAGCPAAQTTTRVSRNDASVPRDAAVSPPRDMATSNETDGSVVVSPDASIPMDGATALVDGSLADATLRLDMTVAPDAARDAAPDAATGVRTGETCESPLVISTGATNGLTLDGYADDYRVASDWCYGVVGPDRVFSYTVPADTLTTFEVSPSASLDVALSIEFDVSSCNAGATAACASAADRFVAGDPERVAFLNNTSSPRTVLLLVDSFRTSSTGLTFDINVSNQSAADGETCGAATRVVATSSMVISGSSVGYDNDYAESATCDAADGPEHVYVVSLQAGEAIDVTLQRSSASTSFDPSLNIGTSAACATTRVCTDSSDAFFPADAEENVTFTNTSGSTADAYIFVDTYSSSSLGGQYLLILQSY